ncbi:MAG: hypothetical protein ACOC0P_06760 [Planctomycetota bacterium]
MAHQPLRMSNRRPTPERPSTSPPPAPLPFPTEEEREQAQAEARAARCHRTPRDPRATADDVLRVLDHLTLTLDDLRREVDEMENDWPKPAA